jgi:uncharacterized membrane protein HdeD (DUF308 family)
MTALALVLVVAAWAFVIGIPDLGAVTIAEVFGLFSIVSGAATLVIAANLHRDAAVARTAVSSA